MRPRLWDFTPLRTRPGGSSPTSHHPRAGLDLRVLPWLRPSFLFDFSFVCRRLSFACRQRPVSPDGASGGLQEGWALWGVSGLFFSPCFVFGVLGKEEAVKVSDRNVCHPRMFSQTRPEAGRLRARGRCWPCRPPTPVQIPHTLHWASPRPPKPPRHRSDSRPSTEAGITPEHCGVSTHTCTHQSGNQGDGAASEICFSCALCFLRNGGPLLRGAAFREHSSSLPFDADAPVNPEQFLAAGPQSFCCE